MRKTISLILSAVILLCCFSACNVETDTPDQKAPETEEVTEAPFSPPKSYQIDMTEISSLTGVSTTSEETNYVLITVKGYGKMLARLYPNVAPEAVTGFKSNVASGFYDGKCFDLIIKHSFIQCNSDEVNKQPVYGEFKSNGFENNLSHKRGVLSLPRADEDNSDVSRFFICTKSAPALNSQHTAFGFVIYGADIIDTIAALQINSDQKPLTDVVIESIKFAKLS